MHLIATLLLTLVAPEGAGGGLLSYQDTVRCSGLTQAASELEGGESARGRQLFDAALYWSLASGQAAAAAGRPGASADADQTRERIAAVRDLSEHLNGAEAALEVCLRRTPDLG
ncbi:hypothetical protein ASG17_14630 [Brevundimonas sp. Leaf363]|uniref:hypothetical protein n=1 Tax=Brevundimonas sp. Leaf363 TaxID=1736353 RepID=UPI00070015F8|nr:hypothetical protein [Brevundimonas sp. Leaf363]KQS53746.1 hypothetical protein ASG17_14630 [Brevundimonas sp. Leaf363]